MTDAGDDPRGVQAVNDLVNLVRECLVQVHGSTVGSGFFIAPGVVASCAHVAGGTGSRVSVRWRDHDIGGLVRWASRPDDHRVRLDDQRPGAGESARIAPYPDFAVIVLDRRPDGHPCVWLDDHLPLISAPLVVVGRAQMYDAQLGEASGLFRRVGDYNGMIRLQGDEIAAGMSGAPVLNPATGGVCAVVKSARALNLPIGGLAVPVRALRAVLDHREYQGLRRDHDGFHRRNRQWTRLANMFSISWHGVAGQTERELRGILAGLPAAEPADHLAAFRTVAGSLVGALTHPLYDYGDVITELAELVPPDDNFPYLLSYAILLVRTLPDSAVLRRLHRWIGGTASTMGLTPEVEDRLAEPAQSALMPSVMVCVRPAGNDADDGDLYRCMAWRYINESDISPVLVDDRPMPLEEVRERLRTHLPELVRDIPAGDQPPMIELIVPQELLDERVEHWPIRPDRPSSVLGQTHPVVVRELDRFDENEARSWSWRKRWQALNGRDLSMLLCGVPCVDDRDHGRVRGWLETSGACAVPVLPGSPKQPPARVVLEAGLESGVPIMIWRRDGCDGAPGISHDACRASELRDGVKTELSAARRHDVPERVRTLRNYVAAGQKPEHYGREVVLLWDDPDRRLPRRPMVTPTEGRHRWVSS